MSRGGEDDDDSVREHLEAGLTRWTLDLADPYAWSELEPTPVSRLASAS